ncbi:hypothetical protein GCM10009603_16570 [Nocardiopsis exhalans]
MKTCADCGDTFLLSLFRPDKRTSDGHTKRCPECSKMSRKASARLRGVSARMPVPRPPAVEEIAPQTPMAAPGPIPDADPWKALRGFSGPLTVTLKGFLGGLPVSPELPACGRSCADAVLSKCAPAVYRDVRWDPRGNGHRAIRRPVRAVVGPATRSGSCASCGASVARLPRNGHTLLQTMTADVQDSWT